MNIIKNDRSRYRQAGDSSSYGDSYDTPYGLTVFGVFELSLCQLPLADHERVFSLLLHPNRVVEFRL